MKSIAQSIAKSTGVQLGSELNVVYPVGTYFVSQDGNDSNDGLSVKTPWKTLAKVNSANLVAGNQVLLKKGHIWRETLSISKSGTSGSRIKFSNYGNGPLPVISGADIINGFTLVSGLYEVSLSTQPNFLSIAGIRGTYKTSKALCVNSGDWYWTANVLSIKYSSNPSGIVEAGARAQCVGGGANYNTFDGIKFTGNNTYSFFATGSYNTVQNCEITKVGGRGQNGIAILVAGNYFSAINNNISDIQMQGIASNQVSNSNAIIQRNSISNCWNLLPYVSGGNGGGISCVGTNWNVSRNYIYGCYKSILVGTGKSINCNYNIVVNSIVNGIDSAGLNVSGFTNLVYNNTVIHNPQGASGHGIDVQAGNGYIKFKNNLVYIVYASAQTNVNGQCIDATNYVDVDTDYNCVFKISGSTADLYKMPTAINTLTEWKAALAATSYLGKGVHDISADPLFKEFDTGNYRLQDSSPCLHAGVDVGLTIDYDGNTILGLPNIGAL